MLTTLIYTVVCLVKKSSTMGMITTTLFSENCRKLAPNVRAVGVCNGFIYQFIIYICNMNTSQENRDTLHPLEVRNEDDSRLITGYAVVFEQWADLGYFKEKINRKALDGVDLSQVVATFNHNFDYPLARVDSNTLKLSIDDFGLKYEFEAPNTTAGNDLLENIRNGNVKGSSFMFTVEEDRWTFSDTEEQDTREILKIGQLIELGAVTMPAYREAFVKQRHQQAASEHGQELRKNKLKNLRKKYLICKQNITKS
jgi:HK97 family phage prohead protease